MQGNSIELTIRIHGLKFQLRHLTDVGYCLRTRWLHSDIRWYKCEDGISQHKREKNLPSVHHLPYGATQATFVNIYPTSERGSQRRRKALGKDERMQIQTNGTFPSIQVMVLGVHFTSQWHQHHLGTG